MLTLAKSGLYHAEIMPVYPQISILSTCLGHLGWHDRYKNYPILVASPRETKASRDGIITS